MSVCQKNFLFVLNWWPDNKIISNLFIIAILTLSKSKERIEKQASMWKEKIISITVSLLPFPVVLVEKVFC